MSSAASACQYCHKHIVKESSLKRHQYYCRAKRDDPGPARLRACKSCVVAKARCNKSTPQCYRCQLRQVDCFYETDGAQTLQTSFHGVAPGRLGGKDHDSILVRRRYGGHNTTIDTQAHVSTLIARAEPSVRKSRACSTPGTKSALSNQLGFLPASNAFAARNTDQLRDRPARSLLFLVMTSFLHMYKDGQLPPFIHWSQDLADPQRATVWLQNCRTILRQYFNARPVDKSRVWDLIQRESERMWFNHESFDEWELLSSIQAMLLYALLRATQQDLPSPGFDLPFLICINHISRAMATIADDQQAMQSPGYRPMSFETWVLYEARRRTVVMFRLLNMICDISDAVSCFPMPGFVIIPLPMPESMWQTRDLGDWLVRFEQAQLAPSIFGMTDEGGLMRLERDEEGVSTHSHDWAQWCAVSGNFGFPIAAAASLLQ